MAETRATDEAEHELYGEARGDELPERLRTPDGRREFFRQARERSRSDDVDAEKLTEQPEAEASEEAEVEGSEELPLEFDAPRIVARVQGREGWLREGKRQLEQHRWRQPDPISRSRRERLLLAAERLEADVEVECRANEAYQHYPGDRARQAGSSGGRPAEAVSAPEVRAGKVNVTDPDSRSIPVGFGFVQGYNAQAAVNERQIVLAAEITNSSTDFSQLGPMVSATLEELERVAVGELPAAVAADAGYWNEQHRDEVTANKRIPVLIPPDKGSRGTPGPGWTGGRYAG